MSEIIMTTENQPTAETQVMNAPEMSRALTRIAHEILEGNNGTQDLALVGIRTGGVYLAHRLHKLIHQIEKVEVPLGELDITLYRDDLSIRKGQPLLRKTTIPFNIADLKVVLVDDVLFTGRTIRAAMDGLGVAIGRRPCIDDDLAAGRPVAPFAPVPACDGSYYLVCRETAASLPKVVAFRQWLLAECRKSRAAA